MLITAKTEIKGLRLELSVADAKGVLKDPSKLQTEIRVMLRHYEIELGTEHEGKYGRNYQDAKKDKKKPFVCVCGNDFVHEAWMRKHQKGCAKFKLFEEEQLASE